MRENESLRRIGRVLHVSPIKNIILKAENLPRIGDEVVDEKLKPMGAVFDIFGPVSSPYVAVRPKAEGQHSLVNRVLYAVPSKPRGRKRR